MKKLFFIILSGMTFALPASTAFAQSGNLSLGVKGGISVPDLKSSGTNPLSQGWVSRLGPYFGLVSEIPLGPQISIQAELNYASQGGKKNGAQPIPVSQLGLELPPGIPLSDYLYANYRSEAILNYLELPVLLKLNFPLNEQLSWFVNAGPYAGYLLRAKNVTKGSSNIYLDEKLSQVIWPVPISFDSTLNIKDEINRFNFGIQAGIGLSLQLPAGKLVFTAGGNLGITDIQKDEKNGSNKTGAATITVGYLIDL